MRPNSVAACGAIRASRSRRVDVLIKSNVRTVVACEVDMIEIIFGKLHQCTSEIARSVINHHRESSHRLSKRKTRLMMKAFISESSKSSQSFGLQLFDVVLVASLAAVEIKV